MFIFVIVFDPQTFKSKLSEIMFDHMPEEFNKIELTIRFGRNIHIFPGSSKDILNKPFIFRNDLAGFPVIGEAQWGATEVHWKKSCWQPIRDPSGD